MKLALLLLLAQFLALPALAGTRFTEMCDRFPIAQEGMPVCIADVWSQSYYDKRSPKERETMRALKLDWATMVAANYCSDQAKTQRIDWQASTVKVVESAVGSDVYLMVSIDPKCQPFTGKSLGDAQAVGADHAAACGEARRVADNKEGCRCNVLPGGKVLCKVPGTKPMDATGVVEKVKGAVREAVREKPQEGGSSRDGGPGVRN